MRKLLLFPVLFVFMVTNGQQKYQFKPKEHIAPALCMALAGAADGFNQALQFRYDGIKKAFPGIRDQWYNPQISWTNKYKNGDPAQGARFPGSKTWLVFTTDAYHFSRFLSHFFTVGAIAVKIGEKGKKWWVYVAEGASYWIINRAAFSAFYNRF